MQEETVDDFVESGHDPLIASLYQMDLDRAQFLLRSYLRVQLQKIEKFMCIRDIGKHLEETVLSKLPDNYQSVLKQSIISREDDMVPKPQLDTFVVAKCERATRPLYLDGSRQFASFDSRQFAILTCL
ncbi:DNA replication complex GINS protein SLD5-like isoform X2 [Gossypium australe]|uniref:DNA replication complex GINS protein SLD5-like isoform X2 n=1 Tax=Gossypium australe TaxID=47621 RepID=A0A5B6WES1_9ROSI|nr:DNA replication complex GINS protein SLD5-like isoform X2 [Gossypium australe]